MRIFLEATTVGRYRGGLNGHLRFLPFLIQKELNNSDFKSSFDEFWLTLSHPPLYVLPGVIDLKVGFDNDYPTLPYSRIGRKTKKIEVILKAPEFSEHFDKAEKDNYVNQFDIDSKYKNLTAVDLGKILIDKFIEAGQIIGSKLKKEDIFELEKYNQVLLHIKNNISDDFLTKMHSEQAAASLTETIKSANTLRDKRKSEDNPKDKLIRDIRVYYHGLPIKALFPYENKYSELFLTYLRDRKFYCPKYHHLYIRVAKTMDAALLDSLNYEDWYVNGIAVIDYDNYVKRSDIEKEKIVFDLVLTGLKDIANIDKLDTKLIDEAATKIRQTELALKNGL